MSSRAPIAKGPSATPPIPAVEGALPVRPFAQPTRAEAPATEVTHSQTQEETVEKPGHSLSTIAFAAASPDPTDPTDPTVPHLQTKPATVSLRHPQEKLAERVETSVMEQLPSATPAKPITLQRKLTIGPPEDQYEKEADRVAQQVVQRINAPILAKPQVGRAVQKKTILENKASYKKPLLQRKEESEDEKLQMKPAVQEESEPEADELQMQPEMVQRAELPEEEEKVQTKFEPLPIGERPHINDLQMKPLSALLQREAMGDEEALQMKPARSPGVVEGDASTELESQISSARGSGQPLDPGLQQQMGQAMGADFGGVTVHTDATADRLNRSIQAKAFTTGQDIFFRSGAYNPGSRDGQELIAHELTHVVQQEGSHTGRRKIIQRFEPGRAAKDLKERMAPTRKASDWKEKEPEAKTDIEKAQKVVAEGGDGYENVKPISNTVGSALNVGIKITADTSSKAPALTGGFKSSSDMRESPTTTKTFEDLEKSTSFDAQHERAEHASVTMTGINTLFSGLEGIMGMAKALSDRKTDTWKRVLDFLTSAGDVTSSALNATKALEYAASRGGSTAAQRADKALPIVDTIKQPLATIKTTVEYVTATYKSWKRADKAEVALEATKKLGEALKMGAEAAQNFLKIVKSSVPMALVNAIPGLGLAITAVSAILNGYKAYKAGKKEADLGKKGITEQGELQKNYPLLVKDQDCFQVEKRGVRGTRVEYLRAQPDFYSFLPKVIEALESLSEEEKKSLEDKPQIKTLYFEKKAPGYEKYRKALENQQIPIQLQKKETIGPLKKLMKDIQSYQYVSKMSEISQKRKVKGWGSFLDNLVSMASQIATMTGAGAPVGSAIQIAQSAGNAARGLGLGIQKLMRRGGARSSDMKKKEYAEHTNYIFTHISELKEPESSDSKDEVNMKKQAFENAENLLEATGVDITALYLEEDTSKKFEMVVEAMGKRD